jgi:hypothetical protein
MEKEQKESVDESALNDAFEARIARGETIEPKDWMPERYRTQLIRMMSQHAHSEIVGMLPEGNWITRAPSLKRKMTLIAESSGRSGSRSLHLLWHRDPRRRPRRARGSASHR